MLEYIQAWREEYRIQPWKRFPGASSPDCCYFRQPDRITSFTIFSSSSLKLITFFNLLNRYLYPEEKHETTMGRAKLPVNWKPASIYVCREILGQGRKTAMGESTGFVQLPGSWFKQITFKVLVWLANLTTNDCSSLEDSKNINEIFTGISMRRESVRAQWVLNNKISHFCFCNVAYKQQGTVQSCCLWVDQPSTYAVFPVCSANSSIYLCTLTYVTMHVFCAPA